MKAAVLSGTGQPFRIVDVPEPVVGTHDVLVETRTCGICRTDLHIQDGLAYVPELPHIPGHEPAGVVVEAGDAVTTVRVGQRVAPYLFVTCDRCHFCRTGHTAQCMNVQGILGVTLPGGFAEYFTVPAKNILPLPPDVPFETAGLTSCAVVTAVHAYRRAGLQLGESAVVLGAGGIGLILIQLLKSAGVRTVAVDCSPPALVLAERLGADLTVPADDADAVPRIHEYAGGAGVDCVFEAVGAAATMGMAAQCVMNGGQIVVIGEESEYPGVDTIQIAQRELRITGSRNGSRLDALDALRMMAAGIVDPPIAHRVPLDNVNEGLDLVRRGETPGRVIVTIAKNS